MGLRYNVLQLVLKTIVFQTVLTLSGTNSNPQGIRDVQFGHQNPILVAPTRTNNSGIEPSAM